MLSKPFSFWATNIFTCNSILVIQVRTVKVLHLKQYARVNLVTNSADLKIT